MSWYSAVSYCQSIDGWLVTINNKREQDYLYNITGPSGTYTAAVHANRTLFENAYWIGLNDLRSYNKYEWVYSTSSYTNWFTGDPNHDIAPNGEISQCTQLNYIGSYIIQGWIRYRYDRIDI